MFFFALSLPERMREFGVQTAVQMTSRVNFLIFEYKYWPDIAFIKVQQK
jgi:hypothetical protein